MKTLTKLTTHIAQVKLEAKTKVQKVCAALEWTEQQYFDFQFENYLSFVERMFHGYPEILEKEVKYSKIFSGFWKNEEAFRNESFLDISDLHDAGSSFLLDEFMFLHNPKSLMHDDAFMHKYNFALKLIGEGK